MRLYKECFAVRAAILIVQDVHNIAPFGVIDIDPGKIFRASLDDTLLWHLRFSGQWL
jgi:hypothetical protein